MGPGREMWSHQCGQVIEMFQRHVMMSMWSVSSLKSSSDMTFL